MVFQAIAHEAEEGGYWAEVPALPGCFTQAETLEELKANIKEAIEGILDVTIDSAALKLQKATVLEIAV
jgi:predicted RNase H-like HicB family nuclease